MTEKIVTPLIEEATSSGLAGFRRLASGCCILEHIIIHMQKTMPIPVSLPLLNSLFVLFL